MTKTERFYSLQISPDIETAIQESLTDRESEDLFFAHLHRNFAYFGGVDKTLSGFVILDNYGDDYYLYDARDTKAVFWQSHEDRKIEPRFEGIEEYKKFKLQSADFEISDGERSALVALVKSKQTRQISTTELAERYQWVVWFYDQGDSKFKGESTEKFGMTTTQDWFLVKVGDIQVAKETFASENPMLKDDPHLAIWWLFVAVAFADQAWVTEIIKNGPTQNSLFTSFQNQFQNLDLKQNLDVLPSFREKRSRFLLWLAQISPTMELVRDLVARSLVIDPKKDLPKKVSFLHHTCLQLQTAEHLTPVIAQLQPQTIEFFLLQATQDHLLKIKSGESAQKTAHWMLNADSELLYSQEFAIPFVVIVAPQLQDLKLVERLCRMFLSIDRLHFGVIGLLNQIAPKLNLPDQEFYKTIEDKIKDIRPYYFPLSNTQPQEGVSAALQSFANLTPEQNSMMMQKILSSAQSFHLSAVKWALLQTLQIPAYPERAVDCTVALKNLGFASDAVINEMRALQPQPNAELKKDWFAILKHFQQAGDPADPLLKSTRERMVKHIAEWLK